MKVWLMKQIRLHVQSWLLFCLLLTGCRLTAQATTLSLTPVSVDNLLHYYDGAMLGGVDQQFFTFATPSVQLANYNTIQVSVNAPAGEVWNISYDGQGFNSADLTFELCYNSIFNGSLASITSSSLQFNFANGSAASLGSFLDSSLIPTGGDRFELNMKYSVVGNFSFSSFVASVTFGNSALAYASLSSFYGSYLAYQYQPVNPNSPDPGLVLKLGSIQTVPEPSTIALITLGLGVLGILKLRRR